MSNKEKDILFRIREVARQSIPKGGRAYLFGSHARGDAHEGSDWDILIILNKDRLEGSDYDNVSFPFVMLGWNINEEINPIMYTNQEWDYNHFTPFHENVENDGVNLLSD